jgi:phosphate transport system protein
MPHFFRAYDHTLRQFQETLLNMAALTRQNLENAIKALLRQDNDLANAVVAADDDIDELERTVDHLGMEALLRFHPVAADLRMIIASMKISTNLERISDHAVGIAKRARKLNALPLQPDAQRIEPLYALAYSLLRDAMDSYTNHDPALGEALHGKDREIDRLHKQLTRDFGAKLEAHEGPAETWLHLIFICRSLERIGDLAVNIGEETVFVESAKDIRHEYRKAHVEPKGATP